MADQLHLDILARGREAWNSWIAQNPSITPDLTWAVLGSVDLRGANLSNANLSEARVTQEQLEAQAKSLYGAIMPNGSKHP